MIKKKIKIGIIGATGYAGEELINILLTHPFVKITYLSAKVKKPTVISNFFDCLKGRLDLVCDNLDIKKAIDLCDLLFLALPHTVSMEIVPQLLAKEKLVIDLSADYRLKDSRIYRLWYKKEHKDKVNLVKAVYGLPEIYRKKIKEAKFIANPGCYPTAAILATAPLLKNKLYKTTVSIIDAKSGYSGAGRKDKDNSFYAKIKNNFKAYKVDQHQHSPEIEQELFKIMKSKVTVTFVPHLLPIERGILETIYLKMEERLNITGHSLTNLYRKFYKGEPFVRIKDEEEFPEIKDVQHTNFCDIGLKVNQKHNLIIIIAVIDNLVKGAAGQAVQNMNIMCGLKETTGLI